MASGHVGNADIAKKRKPIKYVFTLTEAKKLGRIKIQEELRQDIHIEVALRKLQLESPMFLLRDGCRDLKCVLKLFYSSCDVMIFCLVYY